jgi:hypothetical protein
MFFSLSKEPSFTPTDNNYSTPEIDDFVKNNIKDGRYFRRCPYLIFQSFKTREKLMVYNEAIVIVTVILLISYIDFMYDCLYILMSTNKLLIYYYIMASFWNFLYVSR